MKLCRYDGNRIGLVESEGLRDCSAALERLAAARWPWPPGDALIAALPALRPELERLAARAAPVPLASVRLDSPVANPGKIIGAPVNYQKHIDEARADAAIHFGSDIKTIDHYGLFLKANSSLAGPGTGFAIEFPERRTDHEGELAVVIGRTVRHVARAEALDCVAGYTIGLDMTIRGTEERSLRKSIDGAAVLGPWLVTPDEVGDPGRLGLELRVNGAVRQKSGTAALIFDVPRLIEYASRYYTLYPGDVIMTGTPEGVGPVAPGDVVECSIERIGTLRVAVR